MYTGVYDDLAVLTDENSKRSDCDAALTTNTSHGEPTATAEDTSDAIAHEPTDEIAILLGEVLKNKAKAPGADEKFEERLQRLALDDGNKPNVTLLLTTAIGVYQCADMMGLHELKDLAASCFFARQQYFPQADFTVVLFSALFESTPSNDMAMRGKMLKWCIEARLMLGADLEEKVSQLLAVEVVKKYELLSWEIGCGFHREAAQKAIDVEQWRADHRSQELANGNLRAQITSRDLELASLKADLEDVKNAATAWGNECNQCGRSLTCSKWIYQRSIDNHPQYMCKCGKKYTATRFL